MANKQTRLFETEDLPLFSGTAQRVKEKAFQPQAIQIARLPGQDNALDQARTLASGTIATLTGLSRYEDIEEVQARFVAFIADDNPPDRFTCWQDAWDAFTERED